MFVSETASELKLTDLEARLWTLHSSSAFASDQFLSAYGDQVRKVAHFQATEAGGTLRCFPSAIDRCGTGLLGELPTHYGRQHSPFS
jgi:hypothetical protein